MIHSPNAIPDRPSVRLTALAILASLAACTTPPGDPAPEITPAERMSLQNECAKIADRSEREACLEKAAFGERW